MPPENNQVDVDSIIRLFPTKWQKRLPNIIQMGGVAMGVLGYGYQRLLEVYPNLSQLDGAPGWLTLSGVAVVISGMVLHTTNTNTLTTVAHTAISSPPLTSEGKVDPLLSVSCTVQQLINTGDPNHLELASKIVSALKGGAS